MGRGVGGHARVGLGFHSWGPARPPANETFTLDPIRNQLLTYQKSLGVWRLPLEGEARWDSLPTTGVSPRAIHGMGNEFIAGVRPILRSLDRVRRHDIHALVGRAWNVAADDGHIAVDDDHSPEIVCRVVRRGRRRWISSEPESSPRVDTPRRSPMVPRAAGSDSSAMDRGTTSRPTMLRRPFPRAPNHLIPPVIAC